MSAQRHQHTAPGVNSPLNVQKATCKYHLQCICDTTDIYSSKPLQRVSPIRKNLNELRFQQNLNYSPFRPTLKTILRRSKFERRSSYTFELFDNSDEEEEIEGTSNAGYSTDASDSDFLSIPGSAVTISEDGAIVAFTTPTKVTKESPEVYITEIAKMSEKATNPKDKLEGTCESQEKPLQFSCSIRVYL